MKLTHLTLGALLLASTMSFAQQEPKRPKADSTKRKKTETVKKKTKKDTVKASHTAPKISKDYCPPCGMG